MGEWTVGETTRVVPLERVLRRRAELEYLDSFRIATYNVYNLFGETGGPRRHEPASKEQLKALGAMIRDLNADAIAFQEVENEAVIKDLFQRYVNPSLRRRSEERFTSFVSVPASDPRGINVVIATRLAVREARTFHDYEFGPVEGPAKKFSRDLLGAHIFATPDYDFMFFVAHLKSKMGGDEATEKRRLQAREIRKLFEEPTFGGAAMIEKDVVLAGDMNDDPDTETIEILRGDDPKRRMKDILSDVDPNYTYPTHTRYKKTRLDYIFASPSMAERIDSQSARIHRGSRAAEASDHFPASVTVKLES